MVRAPRGRVERMVSAGGIVYRESCGAAQVVLCGKASPVVWALPKGTPTPGETLEETALREVSEETGLDVHIVEPLGRISYWFLRSSDRVRCFKTVHFYLMKAMGGSTADHDPEFDFVRWFATEEATETMTYASEADIVRLALKRIMEGKGHGRDTAEG